MGWGRKTIAVLALLAGLGMVPPGMVPPGIAPLGIAPLAQAASPFPVRIGWAQTPGHLAPLVEALSKRHPELFEQLGKSYLLEPVRFNGSTPQIEAQAVGELEIAAYAPSSLALAISNAHLDVRIVADVIQDGHPGYATGAYVVRTDGPIKTLADVKGKRIATNAIGSASDATMRSMFRAHGIMDSDFTTVETNFANMPAMLEGGKVDLISVLPQFAHGIIGNPKYRVLFTARQAVGPEQAVIWAMRSDVIAAHRAALVDFFADYMRAVRWFLNPKNRDEALAIAADVTKLPKASLAYAFTTKDFYRSPDMLPDIASVQKAVDDSVKLKVIPHEVTISPKYVDLSLIEAAKKRIDGH